MRTQFGTPTSSDADVDVSVDAGKRVAVSEKEVVSPIDDTNKQVLDRGADSSKEVLEHGETDTNKVFVPQHPPWSLEKEVVAPNNDTDKQLVGCASNETSPSRSTQVPISHFRIEKSNPMGLIIPQNQTLLIRSLDPLQKTDRGPAFVTSDMDWMDVATAMPPPFELFTAHDFNRAELVARFSVNSWQGVTGLKGRFEVSCQGDRQLWEVARKGLNRRYQLGRTLEREGEQETFTWKGSTKTVRNLIGDQKKNKGNLKLCTADGEILAVWQQWRESSVLGDAIIFEAARKRLPLEVVVTSCIAVISAERANGLNWFGGIGKG